jgi:hypothetical protein
MANKIKLTLFGIKVEIDDEFEMVPPYSSSKTKWKVKIYQSAEDQVVYLCPSSMKPTVLEDCVSKLIKSKPEDRPRVNIVDFVGPNGSLRDADATYGQTYLIGVLVATVTVTGTSSNSNSSTPLTVVAYAPNVVDTTHGKYVIHDLDPNRKKKNTELQQIHFEAIATEELAKFFEVAQKSAKTLDQLTPSLSFELDYHFKAKEGRTPPVCGSCASIIREFFDDHNGFCSVIHDEPKISSKSAKSPAPVLPNKVKCLKCKAETNLNKLDPSDIFIAPNSNTGQVYCIGCNTLVLFPV